MQIKFTLRKNDVEDIIKDHIEQKYNFKNGKVDLGWGFDDVSVTFSTEAQIPREI